MKLITALVAGVLTLVAAPAPARAVTLGTNCAWLYAVGAENVNTANPDSNAVYWVTKFLYSPDKTITVRGTFPHARYMSFTVYNGNEGLVSTRTDYRIAPDEGSVNPWQSAGEAGGSYTLRLSADPDPADPNALALAPADAVDGQLGYLVYRVYLPSGGLGDPGALPVLTDGVRELPRCGSTTFAPTQAGGAPPATVLFARALTGGANFPNPDNGYLYAAVTPPTGDRVVVIRGRAATTARGSEPVPWPADGADLRYSSLCTNLGSDYSYAVVVNRLADGSTDYGCRHDDVTRLDRAGWYAYVLGREDQRAAIEAVPGTTFVPFSADHPDAAHNVLFRQMMPTAGFTHSVFDVPADGDWSSARSVMREYYPSGRVCSLAALRHCLQG